MIKFRVDFIASVCHNVNKAYCEAIGDLSQPSWDDAPDWQRKSAIDGVKYHLNNPTSKHEDSHNNWMREKIRDGWIWGEFKDPERKKHPCLVPYGELPLEQRIKDYLFIGVVRSLDLDYPTKEDAANYDVKD